MSDELWVLFLSSQTLMCAYGYIHTYKLMSRQALCHRNTTQWPQKCFCWLAQLWEKFYSTLSTYIVYSGEAGPHFVWMGTNCPNIRTISWEPHLRLSERGFPQLIHPTVQTKIWYIKKSESKGKLLKLMIHLKVGAHILDPVDLNSASPVTCSI